MVKYRVMITHSGIQYKLIRDQVGYFLDGYASDAINTFLLTKVWLLFAPNLITGYSLPGYNQTIKQVGMQTKSMHSTQYT